MRPIAKAASLIGAILAAVSIVLIVGGAPASAGPRGVVAGVDLSAPSEVGPGARWWTREGRKSCSGGWILNDGHREFMYSAGHCAPKGSVALLGHGEQRFGEVVISQVDDLVDGDTSPAYDLSAVRAEPGVEMSNVLPGFGEVRRVMTRDELVGARPDLCFVGQKSGLRCGSYVGMMDNRTNVIARVSTIDGDSGGAVFAVTKAGEPVAVGTIVGAPELDDSLAVVQVLDGAIDPTLSFGDL